MIAVEDQARSIFLAALDRASGEWPAFLDEVCGDNADVRARVDQLLQAHRALGSIHVGGDATAATVELPAGPSTVIGPYKLLEQIGEGGFGVVFLAEQTQPVRRKVALKVVKPGMDTRQVVARFEAERQALAIMDHPNIAKVFDGGATATGRPYFVMELVKGVPITRFCDQNHLTARQRLELFVQVCEAVQHAHQKGVIHRDLKPSNVLVSRHDTAAVVKVIDFGIAKAFGQALTDKTLYTGLAQMIGTPQYMSPEQAGMSDLDIDTRSDIYSLGVLVYELLTGTTPVLGERFKEADFDEIRRIIREEEPPKPSTRLSTLGLAATTVSTNRGTEPNRLSALLRGELDWIVMKALEKDRNRRYETASALAADVRRYLADEPVLARPASATYQLGKFLKRNRGAVLAGGVVTLAVFGGMIGAAYGSIEARNNREVARLYEQAVEARKEAEAARDNEQIAKRQVEVAREILAAVEYGRTMQLAHQAWRDSDILTALALLDSTRADLRGWEWRYVSRLCHSELLVVKGHTDLVRSVAFSPDGAHVVTAGFDGTARVWDAKTGAVLLVLQGHTGYVWSVAFSSDGARVVTGGSDGTARVWDGKTGTVLVAFRGHLGEVKAAFSPDGARVITSDNKTVRIWDARTGAEVFALQGNAGIVLSMAFSPDGARVVTGNTGGKVQMWDARTGAELPALKGHLVGVYSAAFSPDGAWVVTAGGDSRARIWDAKTGAELHVLHGHFGVVWSAAFNADGTRVFTVSEDGTARVWDARTGAELVVLKGPFREVKSAALSPDGARVVTGSGDGTVRVWDPRGRAGAEAAILKGHSWDVKSASFSPDGAWVVTGSGDRTARVWDARTGAELVAFKGHTDPVHTAAFSPDGAWVVTGSGDRTARIWDAKTGAELVALRGHTGGVYAATFSPDGARVVTGGDDATARVWDAKTGAELLALRKHTGGVWSAAFSPDGTRVLTGCIDSTARVWDARTGAELVAFEGHTGGVWSAAFSADGARVVTAGGDHTAKVWDARTGAELLTLKVHASRVFSAAFSRDGARVVTAGWDRTTRIWDAKTGAELLALTGHTGVVLTAAFSRDGTRVVTGSADRTVRIWHAAPPSKPGDMVAGR